MGPIVCNLLDAGITVDLNSPTLIRFFHVACFQGELAYVEKLLAEGISTVGSAARVNQSGYSFGSALHVAVVAGRKAVAERLLDHGADLHYKAYLEGSDKIKNRTAIETAIEEISRPRSAAVLENCAYLVESGATEAEAELVLRQACSDRKIKIAKRLLQRGTRI